MTNPLSIFIQKRVAVIFHPFFILFTFVTIAGKAEFSFTPQNTAAYTSFLNLNVSLGQSLISQDLKANPTNGISIYISNYADVIRIFLSEDEKLYQQLASNEEIRLKKIQKLETNSPYYLLLQAEIKMHWAFVKLKMGDEISAMLAIRSAYKMLTENEKKYPEFIPTKKTLGLLNVLIGSIPSNYNWVLALVGMEGNIDLGLHQLQEASKSNSPFQFEALLIQTIVKNYIIHSYAGKIEEAQALYELYPNNSIVNYLYAAILTKNSKGEEAAEVISKRPIGKDIIYFPQVDLLLGELNIFKGNYNQSRNHYLNYLQHFHGKNTLKDTHYKLFLCYWLEDDDEKAIPYFTKITQVGKTLYDSDKHAQRVAENKEFPNKDITKIRLYTDGGYYSKAYALLKELTLGQFPTKREKLEYLYRIARLHHKAGSINDAITYYEKTIELSKEDAYYFAPNSCLQLGYIYQSKNNIEEAKKYFNAALTYRNYDYKNSIDNKAKAALNAIEVKE